MTEPSLAIIDSHAHVWTNDPAFPWSPDAVVRPSYDALPTEIQREMQGASIGGAVLVQYIGYRWDNEYVARAIAISPAQFAGVCRVNPEDPGAPDHLNYWTKQRGFKGVRISPESGEAGDWFRGPLIDRLFQKAGQLKIPIVVLAKPERIPDLLRLLERHSDVDVVIDHFADCQVGNPEHMLLLRRLADYPRVFLKTGHMWSNSTERYPWRDQLALLSEARDVFQASRIMWGSDWPLCREHATYKQTLGYIKDEATFLSTDELALILGRTAGRIWQFADRSQAVAPPQKNTPGDPDLGTSVDA